MWLDSVQFGSVRCGRQIKGDSRGCVDVYKIVGVDLTPDATREEQVERLRKSVTPADVEGGQ